MQVGGASVKFRCSCMALRPVRSQCSGFMCTGTETVHGVLGERTYVVTCVNDDDSLDMHITC